MSGATLTQITDGNTPLASEVMTNFNAINNKFNTGLDNSDIATNAAITLSKLAQDAWTSWTPTFSNLTVGNGTLAAKYVRIGRFIAFRVTFTFGTTSSMGSNPSFTAPVSAASGVLGVDSLSSSFGALDLLDTGTNTYTGRLRFNGTVTNIQMIVNNNASTYGMYTAITSLIPFTWGTGDGFAADGFYEAAS